MCILSQSFEHTEDFKQFKKTSYLLCIVLFTVSEVVLERAFVIYDIVLGYIEDFFLLENLTHFT